MSEPASTARYGRPRCPKCRARPTIQNVVSIRFGFEYLTFRCTSCGLVYDAQVHTNPVMPDAPQGLDQTAS
jgi:rubredoxin